MNISKKITMLLFVLSGLAQESLVDAKSHPFGWQDMFSMIRISDPQVAPDGKWVLYSQQEFDVDQNRSNTDLGMVSMDGSVQTRLTVDNSVDVNGRYLPDQSAILFLSNRSGLFQIWKLPLQWGEAQQLTNFPIDLEGFEISPTGEHVLFWAKVFPDCKDLNGTADRLKEQSESKVKARIYDRLFVRHWDQWKDGRRNHLFLWSLKDGSLRDLTSGWDQDTPTNPWGGGEEVAWSPDGKTVAFASKPSQGEAFHTNVEVYLVDIESGNKPQCITSHNQAWDTQPVFSPDGKKLAYLAMDRPGFEADRFHIELYDLAKKDRKRLLDQSDLSAESLAWSVDSNLLYFTAAQHGRARIFSLDVRNDTVACLVKEGNNKYLSRTKANLLVFLQERSTSPAEVFVYDFQGKKIRQITRFNQARLKAVQMSQPEEFWFDHDGFKIQGWLLKPVGFRSGKKYPLAFLVHGGPQGWFGDNFHYRWNPQFYAGAGYVTVMINFRGSTGYGQKFVDAIRGDWGPGPFSDLMAGLGHVLENYRFVDSKRMCALGASYGGYMINWIAGQEHPFQCLVNHDGKFGAMGFYYNTEELWFPEWEMLGTPWERPEVYHKNSPERFVKNWKTPLLVIHGALDFRVVETEALSTFNALQRLGVPSKLLYFPDENHWVRKPQNSRLWHKTVIEWLDQWTRTERKQFR